MMQASYARKMADYNGRL